MSHPYGTMYLVEREKHTMYSVYISTSLNGMFPTKREAVRYAEANRGTSVAVVFSPRGTMVWKAV